MARHNTACRITRDGEDIVELLYKSSAKTITKITHPDGSHTIVREFRKHTPAPVRSRHQWVIEQPERAPTVWQRVDGEVHVVDTRRTQTFWYTCPMCEVAHSSGIRHATNKVFCNACLEKHANKRF